MRAALPRIVFCAQPYAAFCRYELRLYDAIVSKNVQFCLAIIALMPIFVAENDKPFDL